MADVKTINLNNTSYNIRDDSKIPSSEKGANNGVATLDASGKVPSSQLPESALSVVNGQLCITYTREVQS